MGRSISRKRPWLAALLGALATGLGHLYLRRWRRAIGWLLALFATTALFVEPAAVDALAAGDAVEPVSILPILFVASLSAVDAYLLAYAHNHLAARPWTRDGKLVDCPTCGRELDPDLGFCHWCTTEIGESEIERSDGLDERR